MKHRIPALRARFVPLAAGILVLVVLAACGKKDSNSGTAGAAAGAVPADGSAKARLAWNLHTTLDAYEKVGKTDRKWDKPAKLALTEFARAKSGAVAPGEAFGEIIATNCDAAMQAGCNDPLVRYLYARYTLGDSGSNAAACADELIQAARGIEPILYPPIRKFYVWFRAVNQVQSVYGYSNRPPAIEQFTRENHTFDYVRAMIEDPTVPAEEAYDACGELVETYRGSTKMFENVYPHIEDTFMRKWPGESVTWLLKGNANLDMAWLARGTGYANTVDEAARKVFLEHLAAADAALEKAWELNPKDVRIPIVMMSVILGNEKGPAAMELWFGRAMALDPNNYEACRSKLHYLLPQWYGSREAMTAFGRECVASTNWGGQVPLTLCEAHVQCCRLLPTEEEKAAYYKQPDVWPDIKASYERFFELNPKATGFRHNYAWFAYHCEQWDDLNAQLALLGPVNYDFFGGRAEFDKMVQLAKEHSTKVRAK